MIEDWNALKAQAEQHGFEVQDTGNTVILKKGNAYGAFPRHNRDQDQPGFLSGYQIASRWLFLQQRVETTLEQLLTRKALTPAPVVVCLCGSTRFSEAFREANLRETLAGKIVLSIGCDTKSDHDLALGPVDKDALDLLHFFKIDLAGEILVLNVGGYIGTSTRREIAYARMSGKRIRYFEEHHE